VSKRLEANDANSFDSFTVSQENMIDLACKRFYLLYYKVFEIFPQPEEISVPQLGKY
jgi:hypothetical protein